MGTQAVERGRAIQANHSGLRRYSKGHRPKTNTKKRPVAKALLLWF